MDGDILVIWSVLWYGLGLQTKLYGTKPNDKEKPAIVLEVGGIKRGITWKVGLNGINREANFGPKGNDDTRVKILGLELKPWQYNNEYGDIIIACLT